MTPRRSDFWILLGLGSAWAVAAALVGIAGDFPLNDDWAYAFSTHSFIETGEIERISWTWAPILTHVWAGAFASQWFGFSFETLRWTGLLFGFGACAASYGLARACELGPARSAIVAATLAICPLHFNLSFTFMTDPPFAFWVTGGLAAIALATRASGLAKLAWLVLAGVFVTAATLLRQPGVAVAAAALAALTLARIRTLPQLGIATGVGIAAGYATLTVAGLLFDHDDGGSPMVEYLFKQVLSNPNLLYFLTVNGLAVWVYLGWFLAPVAAFMAPPRYVRQLAGLAGLAAVGVPIAIARLLGDGPPGLNLIWDFGLGSQTLAGLEHLPQAPRAVWWLLNAAGAGSAAWYFGSLAAAIVDRFGDFRERSEIVTLLLFPVLYLAVLALRVPFFDRYLTAVLPALAVLGLVLAGRPAADVGRGARRTAAAGCVLLGLFSLLGTRDYMERHRSRNALLESLLAEDISPRRIDGGFEFLGRYNFDSDATLFLERDRRWVYDDEFLVTYAPSHDGYLVLRAVEYQRWLPPGREKIQVLGRIRAQAAPPRHSPDGTDRR